MTKYVKYVHPIYSWNNTVLKQLGEEIYLTPNGDIKHKNTILDYTKEDEDKAKPGHVYGIIEDDGSFEIEFRNLLYRFIAEAESNICSSKAHIARLKEIGGIQ